jgi:hypothetical protein
VGEINAARVDARWCASLEADGGESELREIVGQCERWGLTSAPCRPNSGPSNGAPTQKGTTRDNDGTSRDNPSSMGVDVKAWGMRIACGCEWDNAFNHGLAQIEVGERLKVFLHDLSVEAFVALRTECLHCWSLAFVEQAHLNKRTIGDTANDATKRINLADQVPLCGPTN